MSDTVFISILIVLILSVIFGYRLLETRVGYSAAERLRLIQVFAFLGLFGFHGWITLGPIPFFLLLALGFVLSFILEFLGVNRGWIFGSYYYTDTACPLPHLGGVPLCYPLAWTGLIYAGFWTAMVWIQPFHDRVELTWPILLLTATLVTLLDFILDPVAVDEGRWVWKKGGIYYGIPWSNFAGWFITVLVVMVVFRVIMGPVLPLNLPTPGSQIYPGLGYGMLAAVSVRVCFERNLTIPALLAITTALVILTRILYILFI